MKIHEILDRDPRTERLANGGQARIVEGNDAELRAEIESFVCDGQFNDALQRILDRYLANLGTSRQDSAWVSGFFGSGKSHLLKMLAHLWVDTRFQDGATARGLVPHGLPDELAAQLRELDTQASRTGTRQVAAAGNSARRHRSRTLHRAIDPAALQWMAGAVPAGEVLLLAAGMRTPRRRTFGGGSRGQAVEAGTE